MTALDRIGRAKARLLPASPVQSPGDQSPAVAPDTGQLVTEQGMLDKVCASLIERSRREAFLECERHGLTFVQASELINKAQELLAKQVMPQTPDEAKTIATARYDLIFEKCMLTSDYKAAIAAQKRMDEVSGTTDVEGNGLNNIFASIIKKVSATEDTEDAQEEPKQIEASDSDSEES